MFSQTHYSNLSITKLTPDDGLSQGSNYFRFEDSKGFMWITANDAINRYDGSTIKVYNLDRYFKNCPNLQQGYGFAEDKENNIYIGSVRGLYIHNSSTDKFTLQKIFTKGDEVAMPFAYHDGKIWCFNKNYEVATYDLVQKRVNFICKLPITPLSSVHVYDLAGNTFYYRWPFIDINNNIWFVSNNKIVTINNKTHHINEINLSTTKQPNTIYYSSFYDKSTNNVIIGTNNGLIIYNAKTAIQKKITSLKARILGRVESIAASNSIIALRAKDGLLIADKKFANCWWVDNLINKIFRYFQFGFDKSGRLWMCDDGLGQIIFDFSAPLLPKLPGEDLKFSKLKQSGVGNFAELSNGDILVQNNYVLNYTTKQLQFFNYPSTVKPSMGFRIETDRKQKGVWFSDINYKNNRLNIYFLNQNRKFTLTHTIYAAQNLGALQQIKVLDNGYMVGTFSNGIYLFNKKSVISIKNQPSKNPFFINIISDNLCAVSYLNNDMWLVDFSDINNVKFIKKILPGIQSFYLQANTLKKQYWVGANKGVYLLDKNFNKLKVFDANNGLAGTYIYGLLIDNQSNVWCSHQHGISSINAKTFNIINYDKTDGIQDWDFNNRAFYKASDGTLYFGGVSGFNFFKPPLNTSSHYVAEAYIDEIQVNNKILLPDTNVNNLKKINLSFTENNISIKAILKDLGNNSKKQLIYRIRETGIKWNFVPTSNLINFNSLAPGKYTLEIGIFNKFKNEEVSQKKIIILIDLPFYRKDWFFVLIAILTTTLLLGIYVRLKLRQQQQVFKQQLLLEQQRSQITADLHDDIGATLSSLQLNSAVASQLINKDLMQAKRILEKIENQSKSLADKIGDIIWSMKPGKDEFMTISSRIKNFANDILGTTNINYKIQIDNVINNKLKDIQTRKNIVFIIKESINNIAKYSNATQASISIKIENNLIYLKVSDNGNGFEIHKATGNGLGNMKKRAIELKGTFNIQSSAQKGTDIAIVIPLVP